MPKGLPALSTLVALLVPGVAWAEDAHTEGDAHSAFPPFDPATFGSTLFWLAISFLTLYWLMSRIALPRLGGIIEHRNATIAADLDKAAAMQKKAEDAGTAYGSALAQAKANAVSIGQKAKDEASAGALARRKTVESDVAGKIAAAEQQIAATKATAMSNVTSIAAGAAAAIVDRLTGVAPTEAEAAKAVAETMAR